MEKAIIYQDLKTDGFHGYELQELQSDSMILKEQIIPGAFGYPPMHITHLSLTHRGKRVLIICQTDEELTPAKGIEILAGALKLIEAGSSQ